MGTASPSGYILLNQDSHGLQRNEKYMNHLYMACLLVRWNHIIFLIDTMFFLVLFSASGMGTFSTSLDNIRGVFFNSFRGLSHMSSTKFTRTESEPYSTTISRSDQRIRRCTQRTYSTQYRVFISSICLILALVYYIKNNIGIWT